MCFLRGVDLMVFLVAKELFSVILSYLNCYSFSELIKRKTKIKNALGKEKYHFKCTVKRLHIH